MYCSDIYRTSLNASGMLKYTRVKCSFSIYWGNLQQQYHYFAMHGLCSGQTVVGAGELDVVVVGVCEEQI